MARGILIVGESGSGKSASMRNLNPKETFIINVQGKDLSFYSTNYKEGNPKEGNLYTTDKIGDIKKSIEYISQNRKDIKNIVVDDFQYVATNSFMNRLSEKGFDKFNDLGKGIWILPKILPSLRTDLNVFIITHDEKTMNDEGISFRRAKRMGKLIDQQVGGIEGYFTYVLFTDVVKKGNEIKHYLVTNNEGDTTAKTPMGMFEDIRIENDLQLVVEKLDKLNN